MNSRSAGLNVVIQSRSANHSRTIRRPLASRTGMARLPSQVLPDLREQRSRRPAAPWLFAAMDQVDPAVGVGPRGHDRHPPRAAANRGGSGRNAALCSLWPGESFTLISLVRAAGLW